MATILFQIDAQDTPLARASGNGIVQRVTYLPFGSQSIVAAAISFAGEYCERSGYYLLGNGTRLYDPGQARFTQPDSYSPFQRGAENSYVYCLDDPVNRVDPSGHISLPSMVKMIVKARRWAHARRLVTVERRYQEFLRSGERAINEGHTGGSALRKIDDLYSLPDSFLKKKHAVAQDAAITRYSLLSQTYHPSRRHIFKSVYPSPSEDLNSEQFVLEVTLEHRRRRNLWIGNWVDREESAPLAAKLDSLRKAMLQRKEALNRRWQN